MFGGLIGGVTGLLSGPKKAPQVDEKAMEKARLAGREFFYGGSADATQQEAGRGLDDAQSARGDIGAGRSTLGRGIGLLTSAALGMVPSVAQEQLKSNTNRGISQLMGMIGGGRGGPSAGLRAVATGAASMLGDAAGQSAMVRAQEMSDARNALTQAGMQQYGLGQQGVNAGEARRAGILTTALGAQESAEERALKLAQGNAGVGVANAQSQNAFTGGLLNTGGMLGAAAISDERVKKNVTGADAAVDSMLKNLDPVAYEYENSVSADPGRHVGVMAQDLERSPIGRKFVHEGGDGVKKIDYGDMGPIFMASLAALNRKIDKIGGGRRG